MRTLALLAVVWSSATFAQGGQAAPIGGDRCFNQWCYVARLLASDGSAAAPSITWRLDPDTGFYRTGANEIGISNGGARAFRLSGNGQMRGDTDASVLDLRATVGAQIAYNSTSVTVSTSLITLDAAAGYIDTLGALRRVSGGAITIEDVDGLTITGVALTSLPTSSGFVMQRDTNRNALWWKGGTPSSTTPWVNLGGGQHPTLERKTFTIEVGQESTATPTWQVAPRLGAGSLTVTIVDAAAATSQLVGTSPNMTDTRGSVTTAAAGSISSGIASSAWVRLDHGPRWCQKVSTSAKTTARFWLGLSAALPGSSDTNANEHVSFRSSSDAADANWMACSRDGATQSCTDTTVSVTTGTAAYQLLCIDCFEGTACVYSVDGQPRVRKTTNLPTVTTKLANYWSVEARAAAARTLYVGTSSVETQ